MTRMKDSGNPWIREIPGDWFEKKLRYLVELRGEKSVTTDYKKYVGLENIMSQTGQYVQTGIEVDLTENLTFEVGDILFGKLRPYLRKYWRAEFSGTASSEFVIIKGSSLNLNFLFWAIQSDSFINDVDSSTYGSKMPRASWEYMKNIKLPFPESIEEQSKIADFLDKKVAQLDKVKNLLEEQIKTLEDYRQSLIYETVTKGLDKTVPLRDSGVDWIGQIPEGWGVGRLKDFVKFQRGFGFPLELQGKDNGEIPFYKVSDLRGNLDEICVSKNYVDIQTTKQNAWVIVPAGAIIAPVIGAALLNNNRKISTTPFISDNNTLAIIPNNKNKYFYYLLKVIDMNWFNNSSTIPAVNISKLANQVIPAPKEEEQRQIADFLEVQTIKTDKLIEIKQKQIDNINQQRQTLIYDVVTGKRRV
ncbi:TPA: restriction endonuclease subunit S [Streptococcus suis]